MTLSKLFLTQLKEHIKIQLPHLKENISQEKLPFLIYLNYPTLSTKTLQELLQKHTFKLIKVQILPSELKITFTMEFDNYKQLEEEIKRFISFLKEVDTQINEIENKMRNYCLTLEKLVNELLQKEV